jgi:hypothetical protein
MGDDRIAKTLGEAEKSLVELSAEAARSRDYDRAAIIIGLAREIRAMAARLEFSRLPEVSASSVKQTGGLREPTEQGKGRRSTSARSRRGRRSAYPQFFRDGESLLKVGFSKRDGEYVHKAPDRVLFALVEVFAKTCGRSRRFTMEEVIPQVGTAIGCDVPSYQSYLCLSWLRSLGLVEQHGRQGYSVKKASELPQQVRARWEQLSPRVADGAT